MRAKRDTTEQPVPSDVDAEEAVLGSILIGGDSVLWDVMDLLELEDFYREANSWIFDACVELAFSSHNVDQLTVARKLNDKKRLGAVGGVAYLSRLVAMVPTTVHAVDYAQIVKQCAVARRIITAGGRIAAIGYGNGDPNDMISRSFAELLAIKGLDSGEGMRTLEEIARSEEDAWQEWLANPNAPTGVSTGLADMDRILGGLKPGLLYVLAARPSIGKSQLALTIAKNVAGGDKHVALFSLEMTGSANLHRMVLAEAGVSEYDIRNNKAPFDWRQRCTAARDRLRRLGISVDDSRGITTGIVRARATKLRAKYENLGLVIVDYAQIMADDEGDNEDLRIGRITTRLKNLSEQIKVPVIAIYALSRKVEERPDKVPKLSDLRYSGQIEFDADVAMFLYRKGYYHEQEPNNEFFMLKPGEENRMDVLVQKHRNGPTGAFPLYYNPATGRIGNWSTQP
jgi:replicative DNA helicase